MLGNTAIARIFERCGLMTDLGLMKNEKLGPSYFPVVRGWLYIRFFGPASLAQDRSLYPASPLQGE